MTHEQAKHKIDLLDFYLQNYVNDYGEESHTAMMMAIKALEQQTCEDCISRSEAIKALKDVTNLNGEPLFESLGLYPWNLLNELPSVNPQPICEEREKGECPYYAG